MRRSDHPLRVLSELPWWASLITAIIVFCALRYLAPAIAGTRPILAGLAQVAVTCAPWVAGVFLLPLPFAVVRQIRTTRWLSSQPTLDRLQALHWEEFERLVAAAYERRGYRVFQRGGPGADGGIDFELRSKGKTLVVQCKRWKTRAVGVDLVRELYGAMAGMHAHGAIFVTTGSYTPPAIDFARDKPLELIDGRGLVALLGSAAVATTQSVPEIAETTPLVTTKEGPMRCPRCGSSMTRRVAKQGANVGSSFWGCTRFPDCRGTRADAAGASR